MMKQVLPKFVGVILFVSLAFVFLPGWAVRQGWLVSEPSYSIEIIFSLAFITTVLFHRLHKIRKLNSLGFIQFYMASIALKMVAGCVLILVVIFTDRIGAVANALLFILSYFAFTGIEIFFLLRGRPIA